MALSEDSANEILRAANHSGKILMVGQVLRFFPVYAEAARLVQSGVLGPIRMAWFRRHCARPIWGGWLADAARSGGGIFDLLIHDIDFSIWLFGEPVSITAVASDETGHNGLITATFCYSGSGPVLVEGGWHAQGPHPFSMSFTIAGERGTLEFSSAGYPLTMSRAGAESTEIAALPQQDGFEEELRYFAGCVASNRQPEKCPPRESAAAVKVALRMLEATTHARANS
jgi:predicted dehydrogenase